MTKRQQTLQRKVSQLFRRRSSSVSDSQDCATVPSPTTSHPVQQEPEAGHSLHSSTPPGPPRARPRLVRGLRYLGQSSQAPPAGPVSPPTSPTLREISEEDDGPAESILHISLPSDVPAISLSTPPIGDTPSTIRASYGFPCVQPHPPPPPVSSTDVAPTFAAPSGRPAQATGTPESSSSSSSSRHAPSSGGDHALRQPGRASSSLLNEPRSAFSDWGTSVEGSSSASILNVTSTSTPSSGSHSLSRNGRGAEGTGRLGGGSESSRSQRGGPSTSTGSSQSSRGHRGHGPEPGQGRRRRRRFSGKSPSTSNLHLVCEGSSPSPSSSRPPSSSMLYISSARSRRSHDFTRCRHASLPDLVYNSDDVETLVRELGYPPSLAIFIVTTLSLE